MIKAEIVADSLNEFGNRATSLLVTFPRIILAELNTHRMFSRNSASSRAIPFEKMVKIVEENPFIPIAWQKDHKGMQGTEYFEGGVVQHHIELWLKARDNAIQIAKSMADDKIWPDRNLTKQLCNRLLEPFMWHTALITATEFENFFHLRCPQYGGYDEKNNEVYFRSKKDALKYLSSNNINTSNLKLDDTLGWLQVNKGQAEIHMMALAEAMWDAMNKSTPKQLKAGEWHIPYHEKIEEEYGLEDLSADSDGIPFAVKIGSVLAARTSYTLNGTDMATWDISKVAKKCDELAKANPIHASPFEHCMKAMNNEEYVESIRTSRAFHDEGSSEKDGYRYKELSISDEDLGWSGNVKGFIQYRKMIPNENRI